MLAVHEDSKSIKVRALRSDQFSLGLVLFELAAGKRAFERPTSAETLAAIIREDPEPLPRTCPRRCAG